ncbi:hypothetical protein BO78DRAFT_393755 [Aspergillus sclerotiicarbonarius CBS 121057]|uniref:CoA-dependent acyltransferase n=1 Tax=Aspergillus sclerotiicarbonarius (strain CBS 121057 / IBT 28362) TaxID=1448318 RepID=A0A319EM67_ASPSB|nr:hypothetical protein BO78DRAFT_393755 [Aspergillus sclerotiicarbonarius CBS 121057]
MASTEVINLPTTDLHAQQAIDHSSDASGQNGPQSHPHPVTHPESLHWDKVNETHYTRSFDPFEQTFSALCYDPDRPKFRSIDTFSSASIETRRQPQEVVEMAQNAWIRLRYLHPALAAEVSPNGFRYIALENKLQLKEWLDETFVVKDWDPSMETQGCEDFSIAPIREKPIMYYFPSEQRFVLRTNHMHADAHAAVGLFQDFFAEMARLGSGGDVIHEPLGAEVQNLASSAFDLAGVTSSSNLLSCFPEPRADDEAFEIPSTNNTLDPGAGKTQSADFTAEQTQELISRAKTMRLGITSFVHAAILHASKKISPETDHRTHSTFLIFNFRERCCGQPPNATHRAAALRIGFWPVQVKMSDESLGTAFRLKHEYNSLTEHKLAVLAAMVPCLQRSASVIPKEYFQGIMPSFFGDLSKSFPETYDSFKVQKFWMVGVPTNERIYLGIQTFRNRLSVRACYNQSYHSDKQVAEYLKQIKKEIYKSALADIASWSLLSTKL